MENDNNEATDGSQENQEEASPVAQKEEVIGKKGTFTEEFEGFEEQLKRKALFTRIFSVVLVIVVIAGVSFVWFSARLMAVWQGEQDIWGHWVYRPQHPVGLDKVDLKAIHTKAMTNYIVGLNRQSIESREHALKRFTKHLKQDKNLEALITEFHQIILEQTGIGLKRKEQLKKKLKRTQYLIWAWNDYLKKNNKLWRLDGQVVVYPNKTWFYGVSYKVINHKTYKIEGYPITVQWLRRVDNLNLQEGYLGHATRPESRSADALVIFEMIERWAVRDLWPMSVKAFDNERKPMARAFAPHVRAEMKQSLSPGTFAILQEGWRAMRHLDKMLKKFNSKKKCHRSYYYYAVPWKGWKQRSVQRFIRRAKSVSRCQTFTEQELQLFEESNQKLRGGLKGFKEAMQKLIQWAAKGISIHEARHAADWRMHRFNGNDIPCPGCKESISPFTLIELSAYSLTFATKGVAASTMYQACKVKKAARRYGASERAIAELISHLLPKGCNNGPPKDLWKKARDLDRKLFGINRTLELIANKK